MLQFTIQYVLNIKVNIFLSNVDVRCQIQMSDMRTHPSRHVVVAGGGGGPVEHLLEAARLEGHDAQHHQTDGDALQSKKPNV